MPTTKPEPSLAVLAWRWLLGAVRRWLAVVGPWLGAAGRRLGRLRPGRLRLGRRWRELAGPSVVPVLAAVVVVLVAAVVQVARPVPAVAVRLAVPVVRALPGTAPALPWPARGQAMLDVVGLGSPGHSGDGKPAPIGSVAKVMTALVVLTDHPLAAGQDGPVITVSKADVADYHGRIASQQSLVPVAAGERLTERQALQALLLPSANNIAQLLAGWDAGSPAAFLGKMNATAGKLGMTGTRYTDPSGFQPDTVSTAADQVRLGEKAMTVPAFAQIVAERSATIPVAGTVRNYNALLGTDGVIGIKTGSTDQAGGNLVFAAHLTVGGRVVTVFGAVMNQPGAGTDAQLGNVNGVVTGLLGALRAALRVVTVVPAGTRVGRVTAAWHQATDLRTDRPVQVLGWSGMPVTVTTTIFTRPATVRAKDGLGTVTVRAGTSTTAARARVARTITAPSPWWRLTRR